MTSAFKCDRCGGFSEGEPQRVKHIQSDMDPEYVKEYCRSCYVGYVEYFTGTDASELNEWDIHGIAKSKNQIQERLQELETQYNSERGLTYEEQAEKETLEWVLKIDD